MTRPLASASSSGLLVSFGLLISGCCSLDDLAEVSRPRTDDTGYVSSTGAPADERREVLACVAEVASDDGDPAWRAAAINAARRWLDPAIEPDAPLRAASLRVLEALHAQSSLDLVAARLAPRPDPSVHVRIAAVAALGSFRGPAAEQALCSALVRDEAREVRSAAARELGELRSYQPAVSSALSTALRDEALEVRLIAARALRDTFEVDLGFDPETWQGWISRQPRFAPPAEPEPEELPYQEDVPLESEDVMPPDHAPSVEVPPSPSEQEPGPLPAEPHDPTEEPGEVPSGPPHVPPPGGGG